MKHKSTARENIHNRASIDLIYVSPGLRNKKHDNDKTDNNRKY